MTLGDAALTSALTVLVSTLVFVLTQVVLKFFIEPIHQQREILGNISDALIFHAKYYGNPGTGPRNVRQQTVDALRQLASQLMAKTHIIPIYGTLERLRFVPHRTNLNEAHKELIGLSNSVHSGDAQANEARQQRIAQLLSL